MTFLIVFIGWIFSLCLHEWAHAYVAYRGGDHTVRDKGYLSFNPLRYTDPMLSLFLPLLFLFMGGIGLPGGAVYIETWRLRSRDWQAGVSLAGPMANLALAVVLGLLFRLVPASETGIGPALAFLGLLQVSAVLLNLLPVPGLDGYGVIAPYLDEGTRRTMDGMRGWGVFVLFIVLWNVEAFNHAFWNAVYRLSMVLGIPLDLADLGHALFMFWRQF